MKKYIAVIIALVLCIGFAFPEKSYGEVFGWPTPGYTSLSTTYYYPDGTKHACKYYYEGRAAGVDIRVPLGTEVLAPAGGTVQSLADLGDKSFGRYFEIKHDNGTVTLYAHLSEFRVNNGQRVSRGDVIALSGSTGNSTGPHLHYEMSDRDTYQYYQTNGYKDPRSINDDNPDNPNPPAPHTPSTITITTDSNLPTTTKGTYFFKRLECTGEGSTTWSKASGTFPAGIDINPQTGELYGWPGETGNFRFVIRVKNNKGEDIKEFHLAVKEEGSDDNPGEDNTITITTDSILPDGERGADGYEVFFRATGNGNTSWEKTSGNFPPNLEFDSLSGRLYGKFTNEASGTYTFTLRARNESGTTEKTFTINVNSIKINTDRVLPDGERNEDGYDFRFSCTGNGGSWWELIEGSFPPNLEFDKGSGRLYGKFGDQTGTWEFTLRASNDSGSAVKQFTLTVREHRDPFVFSGSFNNGKLSEYYSSTVSVNGGAAPYTLEYGGNIPEGLSMTISGNQFVLSGTPSKAGSYSFSLKASDNEGRVITNNYTAEIIDTTSAPDPVTHYETTKWEIVNGNLVVQHTGSSSALTYSPIDGTNGTGFKINGDFPANLTIHLPADWELDVDDGAKVTVSDTSKVKEAKDVDGLESPAVKIIGSNDITLNESGIIMTAWYVAPAPSAATETTNWTKKGSKLIIETNGTPSRYEFDALTSPDTNGDGFELTGLPSGLKINLPFPWGIDIDTSYNITVSDTSKIIPHTEIPGLPETAHRIMGSNTITLNASDLGMTAFLFTAPTITTDSNLGSYKAGDTISAQIEAEATKWTLKFTAENLPEGLSMTSEGLISGSIKTAGTYKFTVNAENCAGSHSHEFYVKITSGTSEILKITTTSLTDATEGQSYSFQLEAEGSNLTWSAKTKLPDNLTLSESGLISGTPTTAGTYRVIFTVKNSSGAADSAAFALKVKGSSSSISTPRVKTSRMPDAFIGEEYSYQLEAEGTVDEWKLADGSTLPGGLDLNESNGEISGTVTESSAKTFKLKVIAANEAGESKAQTVSIKVVAKTPYFKTEDLKSATWSKSYSFTVRLGNIKAETWSIEGALPEGMKFEKGKFSGKPKEVGEFELTITASNGAAEITQDFTLRVASIPPKFSGSFRTGTEGKYYECKLKAKGSTPITWEFDSLPDGLTATPDDTGEICVISGTPTEVFAQSVAITLTNGDDEDDPVTAHKKLTIKAVKPKFETKAKDIPGGTVGETYSYQLALKANYTPSNVTWTYTGNMPAGLTLDEDNGTIYGVPEEAVKNSRFTVYAVNAAQESYKAKLNVTMTIKEAENTQLPVVGENPEGESGNSAPAFVNGIAYYERGEITAENLANVANSGEIIVAILPAVEVDTEDLYEFTVSFDKSAPEGGGLVWHSFPDGEYYAGDSEEAYFLDSSNNDIKTVPEDYCVTVHAWLKPGVIYEPVIAVKISHND